MYYAMPSYEPHEPVELAKTLVQPVQGLFVQTAACMEMFQDVPLGNGASQHVE